MGFLGLSFAFALAWLGRWGPCNGEKMGSGVWSLSSRAALGDHGVVLGADSLKSAQNNEREGKLLILHHSPALEQALRGSVIYFFFLLYAYLCIFSVPGKSCVIAPCPSGRYLGTCCTSNTPDPWVRPHRGQIPAPQTQSAGSRHLVLEKIELWVQLKQK